MLLWPCSALCVLCHHCPCVTFPPSGPGSQSRDVAEASSQGNAALPGLADGSSGPDTLSEMELVFCCSQVQIKAAKQRVVMASLYLGTGLLEQELVSVEGLGRPGGECRGGMCQGGTPG